MSEEGEEGEEGGGVDLYYWCDDLQGKSGI